MCTNKYVEARTAPQLAPPQSPMRLAWERHVIKNPATNLPTNNDDALDRVQQG